MTTSTLAPVDHRLRQLVLQQLEWDSQVDAAGIGVTARNGVVTLSGVIDASRTNFHSKLRFLITIGPRVRLASHRALGLAR